MQPARDDAPKVSLVIDKVQTSARTFPPAHGAAWQVGSPQLGGIGIETDIDRFCYISYFLGEQCCSVVPLGPEPSSRENPPGGSVRLEIRAADQAAPGLTGQRAPAKKTDHRLPCASLCDRLLRWGARRTCGCGQTLFHDIKHQPDAAGRFYVVVAQRPISSVLIELHSRK